MSTPFDLIDARHLCDYLRDVGLGVEAAQPTYIRYKPGVGAVVAVDITVNATIHRGYLRRAVDPGRAAQVVAKALTMKPTSTELGPSVRQLDDHTALFLFPTDAKLRRLRWVVSGRKIRWLVMDTFDDGPYRGDESSVSVLRYKPERRLVGRARLVPKRVGPPRSFVFRLTVEAGAMKLAGINRAARHAGIAAPRPIAALQDGRFHIEEALDASPLVDAVAAGWRDPAALAAVLLRVGRVAPTGLDIITPADDLALARRALTVIGEYQPHLKAEIAALGRLLVAACPTGRPDGTSHGDLHLGQFMVDDDSIYLVDWERAVWGHRARDVGRLLAHPYALSVRRPDLPIEALTSLVSEAVDELRGASLASERDLGFYLAVAFIDQVLLVSRHLEPAHARRAASLLHLATRSITHGTNGLQLASPTTVSV